MGKKVKGKKAVLLKKLGKAKHKKDTFDEQDYNDEIDDCKNLTLFLSSSYLSFEGEDGFDTN
jgi:hypothetical protein